MKFKIPLNRIIVFFGPPIAAVSAAVAAWLVAKVNVLGLPGLDKANTATWIAGALTALLVAGLHALAGWGWLKGHHIELQGIAGERIQIAAAEASRPQFPSEPLRTATLAGTPDPDADADDVPPGLAGREPDDPAQIPADEGDPGRAAMGGGA